MDKWWAYKTVDGEVVARLYVPWLDHDVKAALDSAYVDDVMEPFPAVNRADAKRKARKHFRPSE